VSGSIGEVAFELLVGGAVNADAGVPLGFASALGSDGASAVGDGIALETDRVSAAVADLVSLLLLELVVAFGGQQHKPVSVSDVLHVGEAASFAIGFLTLVNVDAVFGDQFLVEESRIFAGLDSAGDVVPVPVSQIADGDLLDQSLRCCGDAAIAVPARATRRLRSWFRDSDRCNLDRVCRLRETYFWHTSITRYNCRTDRNTIYF